MGIPTEIAHEEHVDAEPVIELELEHEPEAAVVAEQADELEQWLEDELENNQYSEAVEARKSEVNEPVAHDELPLQEDEQPYEENLDYGDYDQYDADGYQYDE